MMADDTVQRQYDKTDGLAAVGHLRIEKPPPPGEALRPAWAEDATLDNSTEPKETTK